MCIYYFYKHHNFEDFRLKLFIIARIMIATESVLRTIASIPAKDPLIFLCCNIGQSLFVCLMAICLSVRARKLLRKNKRRELLINNVWLFFIILIQEPFLMMSKRVLDIRCTKALITHIVFSFVFFDQSEISLLVASVALC